MTEKNGVIKYKAKNANYKIDLKVEHGKIIKDKTQITVNNLLLNENILPLAISKKRTFDEIISLSRKKRKKLLLKNQ
ncbi:MAG: hypothetical protein HFI87_02215 [Bacilli bacterium]|nr:hypothetical protein [Bacilli bacterium]